MVKKDGTSADATRLASVCGWCPDAQEQTTSARANGFDVTHGICPACAKKFKQQDEQIDNEAGEQS